MKIFGFNLDFRSKLDKQDREVVISIKEAAKQAKKQKLLLKINEEIKILSLKKEIFETIATTDIKEELKKIQKKLKELKNYKNSL